MSTLQMLLLAALVVYSIAVLFLARRAVRASDPTLKRREAVRLIIVVSLGAPLAAALALSA